MSQNCVLEEQYPCPQVPEEPGIGPRTGALKGPQIIAQRSLCPSAVSLLLSISEFFSEEEETGFVGT